MGHTKDFYTRIRGGGDDAVAAVKEYFDVRQGVLEGITNAFAGQRWIPVSERLPEVGQRVLAYEKPELVVVAEIHRYATGGCGWSADAGDTAYSVFPSHWMPLPTPPEATP